MALTVTNNGDGTSTARFAYSANTTKINTTLTNAAHDLWRTGGDYIVNGVAITWDAATNTQKQARLDAYVKTTILALGQAYRANNDAEVARLAAINASTTEHDLG